VWGTQGASFARLQSKAQSKFFVDEQSLDSVVCDDQTDIPVI
jgi:hypothetical protein